MTHTRPNRLYALFVTLLFVILVAAAVEATTNPKAVLSPAMPLSALVIEVPAA